MPEPLEIPAAATRRVQNWTADNEDTGPPGGIFADLREKVHRGVSDAGRHDANRGTSGDAISPRRGSRSAWDASRSLWWAKAASRAVPSFTALAENLECDVAIVGGGLTGVFCAYHLKKRHPEKRVVLLEARRIGAGASGSNGGLLLNGAGGGAHDIESVAHVHRVTQAAIDDLDALVRSEKLAVSLRRGGLLDAITDARRAERAEAEVEALRAAGLPHRFLAGDELRARVELRGAVAAVLDPGAGSLDSLALLHAMIPLLLRLGVEIHEATEVRAIEEGVRVRLVTSGGVVTATAIVLATNAYTPRLGYFAREIVPLHSHVIATAPMSREEQCCAGWNDALGFSDDRSRLSFGQMTEDGELVFGGGSNAAYDYTFGGGTAYRGDPKRPFDAVEKSMRALLPKAGDARIAHRWTGPLALSWSRVCAMGVRGSAKNVYYALGYSGHGLTLSTLAGRVIADLYDGDPSAWRALPFFEPEMTKIPREPLRWVGYQLYTRLTGRTPRPRT